MRLRLHQMKQKRGLLILESPPQMRTILTYSNKGRVFVPFPYLIHVIGYKVVGRKFQYSGIYGRGLSVYLRDKPLNSLQSKVFLSPTDMEREGLVCTPHEYDGKQFDTLRELTTFVLAAWWGTTHGLGMDSKWVAGWEKTSLENVNTLNWSHGGFGKPKQPLAHYLQRKENYDIPVRPPLKLDLTIKLVDVAF